MQTPQPRIVAESWRTSADYRFARAVWQAAGRPVTFVNGCFDIIHSGHARLIRHAVSETLRLTGDPAAVLVVGVNSNASVTKLKGAGRPVLDWRERADMVAALAGVDVVVGFDEDNPADLVADLKPLLLVKGSEYAVKPAPEADVLPPGSAVLYLPRAGHLSSSRIVDAVLMAEGVRRDNPPEPT